MFGDVVITEHFFESNAADWCNLLKTLDVKLIFVAENDVMERLALYILLLKVEDILHGNALHSIIYDTVYILIQSETL